MNWVGNGARVELVTADLTDHDSADRIMAWAASLFGKVDILINNAGAYIEEPIGAISDQTWDGLFELNVASVMRLTRAVVPGMQERRWGRIINISSILGIASRARCSAYSATKAAVIGMTRSSALDLGGYGITVNCLAPGAFNARSPDAPLSARQQSNFERGTALGRWGKPQELIGPLLLLASEAGSYMTGSVLVVDGGALASTLY